VGARGKRGQEKWRTVFRPDARQKKQAIADEAFRTLKSKSKEEEGYMQKITPFLWFDDKAEER
jgi:hypothetical protein